MVAFEHLGMDAEAICRRAGLDHDVMSTPSARIPRDDYIRFWEAAAELSDDTVLGLHAGEQMSPRRNHILAMLAISGRTVGDGVTVSLRYQNIVADGELVSIEQDGSDTLLRFHLIEDLRPFGIHPTEFVIAMGQGLLHTMTLGAFRTKEIRFAHRYRGCLEEYERVFDCPVLFEQPYTAMVIAEEMWNLKLEVWDPVLRNRLEAVAAELNENIQAPGFVGSASRAIRQLLPRARCDLAATAKELRMSDRTLQRRLQEEGTSFRELLEATRRAIVGDGIERSVSSEEIARRAGFASERALQRAISRWGGRSEV